MVAREVKDVARQVTYGFSCTPHSPYKHGLYNPLSLTKTYTQYIYDTYEVDHYIYEYMYPIIQWTFTLVNIRQYHAPGYHSVWQ